MKFKHLFIFICLLAAQILHGQNVWIQLDSLKAVNLEEDKGPFATLADEIMVIEAIYNFETDSLVHWESYGIEELSDSLPLMVFNSNEKQKVGDNEFYFLMLVEVDNEISTDSISISTQKRFIEYAYYPIPYLLNQIRLALGDDDLLAFLAYDNKRLAKLDAEIECKGMHMFNRYHYIFYLGVSTE